MAFAMIVFIVVAVTLLADVVVWTSLALVAREGLEHIRVAT